ncbi:MAG: arabinan endo-1,5-alpha-L-arabinosidase [Gammaproteobacteria bacterium]|nr:MAG: arabinan endo-1,5-alpha-L-arabinosidase [Gammaproteobacteria bacterium]
MFKHLVLMLGLSSSFAFATDLPANQVIVHDPVMAKEGKTYYVFSTSPGLNFFSSTDLKKWRNEGPVLKDEPKMARQVAPAFAGHLWAPDIQFHNGQYYLYYSASAFGKNTSGIGVSVNKTLNPKSPDYEWKELGTVIQSIPGRDDWNAIDSNIIQDEKGDAWMLFGSFWGGIKMFKLNAEWTKPAEPQEWHELAERVRSDKIMSDALPTTPPQSGAVEGPFIFKKGDYYYLFVSFDFCCRGKDSTYNMRVGRAKNVTGPYVDKDNRDMRKGGGSLVLAGDVDWPGVGHNSAYTFDGKDYLVFHGYDTSDKFLPKLKILEMKWDKDQWPIIDAKDLGKYKSTLK